MEPISAEYQATVDWPGMDFWRELGAAYPEAKVILTVRDPERWYDSAAETILRVNGPEAEVPADRLLVYDVAQGRAPLCDVLGVRVPAGEPFPRVNDAAAFRAHIDRFTTAPGEGVAVQSPGPSTLTQSQAAYPTAWLHHHRNP